MAKTPAKKKKVVKKTAKRSTRDAVILSRPVKPFDLTGKMSDAEQLRQIGALKALMVSEGWILLRMTLEAQVKVLDEQIITKLDLNGKPLTDAECDRLREQRNVKQGLIDKPELLVGELERVEEEAPDDDPYYRGRSAPPRDRDEVL
jgi:hypothetical protein